MALKPDLSQEPNSEVESSSTSTSEQPSGLAPETSAQAPSGPIDLDSAERFKYGGKEYTRQQLEEWRSNGLRQEDYTRKTQEIAADRKFSENLAYDLRDVKKDPRLVSEFKRVYPEKYHHFLDELGLGNQEVEKIEGMPESFVKRFTAVESEFMKQQESAKAQEVKALEKQLTVVATTMLKKYPLASEDEALAKAESLQAQKVELTDEVWENIYKSIHNRIEKYVTEHQKQQQTKQVSANKKAKDSASGGGIPGQAPREFRSIKEATDAMLRSGEI